MKRSSNSVRGTRQWTVIMMVVVTDALAACGGGGDGGSSGAIPTVTQSSSANITVIPACNGSNYGALGDTYAGSDMGVWQATNTGGSVDTVPVPTAGLADQSVTLVYTSQSAVAQPIPFISLLDVGLLNTTGTPVPRTTVDVTGNDANAALDRQLSDLNIHTLDGYATDVGPFKTRGAFNNTVLYPQPVASVGTQRTWNHQQLSGTATVRTAVSHQQTAATGRRIVNLWVESAEYGPSKISDGIVNTLITKFTSGTQSVYTLATPPVDQSWGNYSSLVSLIDPSRALNIVVPNTRPDSQAHGRVGYSWARNNFATSSQPLSNQSLSLYVNSETIYLSGNDDLNIVTSTFGHESTYTTNFYQHGVLYGSQYIYGT